MPYIVQTSSGRSQIDKKKAFCHLLNHDLPSVNQEFTNLLGFFDEAIQARDNRITTGALSNCHGDWYEWLLAIAGWNYHVSSGTRIVPLLLPNISRFDVSTLYEPELMSLITDLRNKVQETASVRLVTSNPDFVLINKENLGFELPFGQITSVDETILGQLETLYENFVDICSFESIVGYLSVKTSLRPDRRLQIPHEGSLMKAIYTHLQTRKWVISPKGLRYYAISCAVSDADVQALKTVATHSITTVNSLPQAAVDEVFAVNNFHAANEAFSRILAE